MKINKKSNISIGLSIFTLFALSGCVTKSPEPTIEKLTENSYKTNISAIKFPKVTYGEASYYAKEFNGKKTASGEIYNMYAKTAAHKTLPFNTMVRVTDMVTHKSDIVRINDRGPYVSGRIIDLSYASAKKLGLINRGVTDVKLEIVGLDGKIDKRLLLPVSTQACVGDKCKASIVKSGDSSEPFSLARDNSQQVIESVYDNNDILVNSNRYNSSQGQEFNKYSKTAIQVGAFRRYKGAKIYARRYGLLNKQYKTVIKKDIKDAKPIYRVRIEGFSNEKEARVFMSRYSLNGAFLVRR